MRMLASGVTTPNSSVDVGGEQAGRFDVVDSHGQQQTAFRAWVLGVESPPLGLSVARLEVGGRQDGPDPFGSGGGVLHLVGPVVAGGEVPRLDHHLVALGL